MKFFDNFYSKQKIKFKLVKDAALFTRYKSMIARLKVNKKWSDQK